MDTKDIMVICVIFKLGHLGSCRIEKEIIECGDDRWVTKAFVKGFETQLKEKCLKVNLKKVHRKIK